MALENNGLDITVPSFFTAGDGVASDISRPFLFRVEVPTIISGPLSITDGQLTAFARTTKLPSFKLKDIDIAYAGMKYRMAGSAEFSGDWNINFLLDETHSLREQFIRWQLLAHDPNNLSQNGPGAYKSNTAYSQLTGKLNVFQLDKTGNPVSVYSFVGAFPKEVGEISLGQNEEDPESFDVNFSYDYFTVAIADGASATEFSQTEPAFNVIPNGIGSSTRG